MFDQPTSALDSVVEGKVQSNIDAAMKGRTFLVTANRISTIKNSDKIFVLGLGRVREQGTY